MTTERVPLPEDRLDGELVARAVAAIGAGRLVVLPTETVYGIAVSPDDPRAVRSLRELKGRLTEHVFTWHLGRREDLAQIAAAPGPRVERLLDRYWPGPLTVVVPGLHQSSIGVRLPAHEFTRAVIEQFGRPLWMTSVNRTGEPPLSDPQAIARAFPGQLELLFDSGPSTLQLASTIVRCTEPVFAVLREGILSAREVLVSAAETILFVCTGNTCRSPLAEAIAGQRTAAALDVPATDLLARGIHFCSAGVATMAQLPASDEAIDAGAELGLDLAAHRSAPLERRLAGGASRIYCLTRSHRLRVLELLPELRDRTKLLRPDGRDIADPFGGDLPVYRRVRDEIAAAVDARVAEWAALV